MEVYTLNDAFQRVEVIDYFESLIWTERFIPWGDFDMVVESTEQTRKLLGPGQRLAMNESLYVMIIETVENGTDAEGKKILRLTGRSLEAVLEDRIAHHLAPALGSYAEYWEMYDAPGTIARYMFSQICIVGALSPGDIIPYAQITSELFPPSNIDEPSNFIRWRQKPDTLYNALKELTSYYALGFRLVRNYDTSELHFDVYTGADRRSSQTELPVITFSPEIENFNNVREFTNTQEEKNVALVISQQGSRYVYADGASSTTSGFSRKVLVVDVGDVAVPEGLSPAAADQYVIDFLDQKGLEALTTQKIKYVLEGEVRQDNMFVYQNDYYLGDLVDVQTENNTIVSRRVTEQIFVSDAEGERAYPTLSEDPTFTSGTWDLFDGDAVWDDFNLEVWDDL